MSTEVGSSPHPRLVLAATTLANAMVLVDQTAVPLTLPAIMRHYDVGSQSIQWVLNGSLVSWPRSWSSVDNSAICSGVAASSSPEPLFSPRHLHAPLWLRRSGC
jgi:hypothetical protein